VSVYAAERVRKILSHVTGSNPTAFPVLCFVDFVEFVHITGVLLSIIECVVLVKSVGQ